MADWRVAGFVEQRELGRGGQGRVVLALHATSGDPVAIKYLTAGGPAAMAALRTEAQMLGRLTSPYIARLYRFVEHDRGAAIVMEAVDGASLKAVLAEHTALAPEAALLVLKGSLLGLAAAHDAGIVHRDYKPANVIVRADGLSKLIDFGIAVLAGEGSRSGTPAYMAPEQRRGEPAAPATDVYAATCVFAECVTGRRPVAGVVPTEDVPEPLRPLVSRGTAENPADRPDGAAAFVAELESAASAAYGADWEHRGLRALAAAAAVLAPLFPLAALLLPHAGTTAAASGGAAASGTAANASGAAGGAGTGAAGTAGGGAASGGAASGGAGAASGSGAGTGGGAATASGSGLGVGGKVAVAVAGAAVVAAAAGGTWYLADTGGDDPREPEAGRRATPVPVVKVAMAVQNGPAGSVVRVENGQYAKVSGLGDPALERRANAALRGPLDRIIATGRAFAASTDCQGQPVTAGTKAKIGMRGPRLVSVRYYQETDLCRQATGAPGGEVATVDLRTGRALTARDVFLPSTLTAQGVRTLRSRLKLLPIDDPFSEGCTESDVEPFKPSDFFPGNDPAVMGAKERPPYLSAFFTPGGFAVSFMTAGSSGCRLLDLGAPYAQVRDLLKPEVAALLPR
ncbi:protein kinase domain-containing protein [Actinomadura verrucosospora]|uniref:non-specific serine/threonine protein kinase n=1 Tax=Actinomadura verrucosospora TaxID=46165 RepID=A0A7D4A0X2_ACTVE|nr:serine/threonine-protein kinase [Actinomadura verrucosospora]QKG23004.1 serine/threonine protein kinase [Actinomadura verrucosospora]